jgi:hypothetical protein
VTDWLTGPAPTPSAIPTSAPLDPTIQVLLAFAPTVSATIALAALIFAVTSTFLQRRRDNAVDANSVLIKLSTDAKAVLVLNDGPMPIVDVSVHVNSRRAGGDHDRPSVRAKSKMEFAAPSGVDLRTYFTNKTFVVFADGRGQFWVKRATGLARRISRRTSRSHSATATSS